MDLIETIKKEENVEEIYKLLESGEKKDSSQRAESLNILEGVYSLYTKLQRDRGKVYCSKHCPDIPKRMRELVDKLMKYNS